MMLEPREVEERLRDLFATMIGWAPELVTWDPVPSQNFDDFLRLSFVSDVLDEGTENEISGAGFAISRSIHRAQIGVFVETTSGMVAHHLARQLAEDLRNRGTRDEFRELGLSIVGEPSAVIDQSYEDPEDASIVSAASFELPIRYTSTRTNARKRFVPVNAIRIAEGDGEPQTITRP